MGVLIPEMVLFGLIERSLEAVRVDFHQHPNEKNTLLYAYFGELPIVKGKWDWFQQAKDLFLREEDHPRRIGTELFFNSERVSMPTVHITLPSEMGGNGDGLGIDEGYAENIFNPQDDTIRVQYTRMFETQYQLLITSDNTLEVQLLYTLLRGMFIGLFAQFEFAGLRNPKLSGQDLRLDSSIVPEHIYTRALGIRAQYEVSVPNFFDQEVFRSIAIGTVLPI